MNYISMSSSEDIIEHFGVKGMRWGRRNTLKTMGKMGYYALRYPNLTEYARVKESGLHRDDRAVYDYKKGKIKQELSNNPKALRKKLKQLKKDYKKDNSFTGSLNRRASIMDEHLAARNKYKDEKRNATTKRARKSAYKRYQESVNPYLH